MTALPVPPAEGDAFATAVRGPSLRDRLRVPDQAMQVAAAVLLPLGLAMVLLSWWGAARTPYLFEQVPYLISGGLLGLGLVLTGGFVFFGSWIARTARAQQAAALELLEAVRAVRDEIAASASAAPELPLAPPQTRRRRAAAHGAGSNGSALTPSVLVATANGSMLHRPDCVVVASREDLHAISPEESGVLQPCRLCNPLATTATARA
jgi:hypothetical protein